MTSLTPEEQLAYKLLFQEGCDAITASDKLKEQGYMMTPQKLVAFKATLGQKIDKQARDEHMMSNMLESFDRTKIEFEDCVSRIKRLMDTFEAEKQPMQMLIANKDMMTMINTALKVLGKLQIASMDIKAKQVNIVQTTDFVAAFRRLLNTWFDKMDVTLENGKIIFNKPSPELIDDYNRWRSKNLRADYEVKQG